VQAVERYVRPFRAMTAAPPPGPVIPATRQITRWLLSRPATLNDDEQAQLAGVQDRCPHLNALAAHVRSFAEMMTRRRGQQELEAWLTRVQADDQPELRSFANGIRRDQQAVTAGLTLPYSSAAVEGNVTRIILWNQACQACRGYFRAMTASTTGVGSPLSANRSSLKPTSRKACISSGSGRWVAPTLARTPWSVQDALVQWLLR